MSKIVHNNSSVVITKKKYNTYACKLVSGNSPVDNSLPLDNLSPENYPRRSSSRTSAPWTIPRRTITPTPEPLSQFHQ